MSNTYNFDSYIRIYGKTVNELKKFAEQNFKFNKIANFEDFEDNIDSKKTLVIGTFEKSYLERTEVKNDQVQMKKDKELFYLEFSLKENLNNYGDPYAIEAIKMFNNRVEDFANMNNMFTKLLKESKLDMICHSTLIEDGMSDEIICDRVTIIDNFNENIVNKIDSKYRKDVVKYFDYCHEGYKRYKLENKERREQLIDETEMGFY